MTPGVLREEVAPEVVLDFVGRGQIQAAGGVDDLRGSQRPMQFATQDVITLRTRKPEIHKGPGPLYSYIFFYFPIYVSICSYMFLYKFLVFLYFHIYFWPYICSASW